jgi:hypothetical protein
MNLKPVLLAMGGLLVLTGCGQEPALIVRPSAPPATVQQVAERPVIDMTAKLRQTTVQSLLEAEGIKRFSNGKCVSRWRRYCTSYEGMRRGTIEGVIALKRASGCKIRVSGGTETGHSKSKFSHGNGYKADVMPTKCVDAYIRKNMRQVGKRSDGTKLYRARSGPLYADEHGTHWDILFAPSWCIKRIIRHARCG